MRLVCGLLVALLAFFPHVTAALVPWPSEADPAGGAVETLVSIVEYVGSPSAAPAGEYIDLVTNVVYRDDGAGFEPVGMGVPWFGYGYADVYSFGTTPHPFAASTEQCSKDFCIAWIVAITGAHHIKIEWIAHSDCGVKRDSAEFGPTHVPDPTQRLPRVGGGVASNSTSVPLGLPPVETVTYTKGTWHIDWCERGYASVRVYVDDVPEFLNGDPYCRPLYGSSRCY